MKIKESSLFIQSSSLVDFKASNGYLGRFANRKSIVFGTVHGESDPSNIFNGDEMGLFWRLHPNKTYKAKEKLVRFGKANKERFTVFVAARMIGEKLPLAIIGKSDKPRNFNSIERLNISYFFYSNAWMTSEVFLKVLNDINKIMVSQKRFIFFFVDNCSSHPDNLKLSNVTVLFLASKYH
ncbi:unnamed protein product [Brachionus calyciflorus]|uniref:DDE-1 domain-containing protein n=1 Tax=Brachionus calyciflorus TaxID=104777 RepID=A0A814D4D6_9BILA|nr:unnamed protein product [Brachionus calyciflorus]